MLRMKMANAKMCASWAHIFCNLLKMAVASWSFIHLGGVLQGVHAAGQLFHVTATSSTSTSSAKSLQVENAAGFFDKETYSRGSKDSSPMSPDPKSALTGTGRVVWEGIFTSDEDMLSNVGAVLSPPGTGRMVSQRNAEAIREAMKKGSQEVERPQTCGEFETNIEKVPGPSSGPLTPRPRARRSEDEVEPLRVGESTQQQEFRPGFLRVQGHLHGETARSSSQQQELQTQTSRAVRSRLSTPGLAAVPTRKEKSRPLLSFAELRPQMSLLVGPKDCPADAHAENQGNGHEDLHEDGPQGHALQQDVHDLQDHAGQVGHGGLHVQQDGLQDFETVRRRGAALFCDDMKRRLGLEGPVPDQGPAHLPGNPQRAIFASDGKNSHPDGKRMTFEDAVALSGQPVFYGQQSSPFASSGSRPCASSPFSSAPPLPFAFGSSPFVLTPFSSSSSTAAIAGAAVYGPTDASLSTLMSLADQQQKRFEEELRSCMLGQDQAPYPSQAHGDRSSSSSSAPSRSQGPPAEQVAFGSAALFVGQEKQIRCEDEPFLTTFLGG
ncbi:unnamed protein product [Amoebophrya sp. A25]|nr:unnamed protein product [Amoebophrya sp. A25]|eukprot:GSA25T00015539001.1